MANKILVVPQSPAEIIWDSSGTDGTITITSLGIGAARQGSKVDMFDGAAGLARQYTVMLQIDTGGSVPTAGDPVELWWSSSRSATAGTDNAGQTSGADAVYSDPDDLKKQLELIGILSINDVANNIQRAYFPDFRPLTQFGMPVVINNTDQILGGTAADHIISFIPQVDEIQ